MFNQDLSVANSRYLTRSAVVAVTGWLSCAMFQPERVLPAAMFWPLLAMLFFTLLDRPMLRPRNRRAERLATSAGQLLVSVALVLCIAALLEHRISWKWPAVWLATAIFVLLLLETFNDRIIAWRPALPRVLLAGDCVHADAFSSQLGNTATRMTRQQAIAWLNEVQASSGVDEVVIFDPRLTESELEGLLKAIQRHGLRLYCPTASGRMLKTASALSCAQKRLFDIFCAATLIMCCAPLMLTVGLLVRLQDGGPALFRQQRMGMSGKCITVFKFRSMQVNAGNDPLAPQAQDSDPRITRLGHWLRYWGIDELPQLLNVLYGDMSMVGPRPHAVAHDLQHGASITDYYLRQAAKPGITGLAQVRGMRGETRFSEDMIRRIDADLEYIARQSLRLDVLILLATPVILVRKEKRLDDFLAPPTDQHFTLAEQPLAGLNGLSEITCQDARLHEGNRCEDSTAGSV